MDLTTGRDLTTQPLRRFSSWISPQRSRADQTRGAQPVFCFPDGSTLWPSSKNVMPDCSSLKNQNEETTEIYLLNISWIFIDHIDQRTSGNPLASPLVVEVYSDFAKHLKGFNFDPALGRQDWCNLCNLLGLHKRVLCQLLTFLRMSWDAMSFLDLWGSPLVCFFSSECSQYFGKAMDQAVPPRYGSTELGGVGTSAMLGYGDMPPPSHQDVRDMRNKAVQQLKASSCGSSVVANMGKVTWREWTDFHDELDEVYASCWY